MTVLAVMRPPDRLPESVALAESLGFEVLGASPIDIMVQDSEAFSRFITSLANGEVDMVVFTSSTAVEAAIELAERRGTREMLLKGLNRLPLIAIGPATGRKLAKVGLPVNLLPEKFTSEGIVEAISKYRPAVKCASILRSNQGSAVLRLGLAASETVVFEVAVYAIEKLAASDGLMRLIEAGKDGKVDAFAFTSSLSARTFVEAWADSASIEGVKRMLNSKFVGAIGPPTCRELEQLGIKVDVMPAKATFADLLRAMRVCLGGLD